MEQSQALILSKIAGTIRLLSIEAVQKANSGHPGLPLGCADVAALLYGTVLQHNPKNPSWIGRDRFILSAGHGSMLLYSCLHLAGFDLSLEEIKQFRQLHSKTPGHPESHMTPGVEATTGPLGQGVANAVGQALGLKILKEKFGAKLFSNKVYCLAGDGCIMEGISSEASSLAGHLKLDNLVLIYDANQICLDGKLDECCSEDTKKRYESYGFETIEVADGNNLSQIAAAFDRVKQQKAPLLLILRTKIGFGSPKEGTSAAHGSPLGAEGVAATLEKLNLSKEPFFVAQEVKEYFAKKLEEQKTLEADWHSEFKKLNSQLQQEFIAMQKKEPITESDLRDLVDEEKSSGRAASNKVLQLLAKKLPYLYGGSADLSGSDFTMMKEFGLVKPANFTGRNIKFGVREFAMAAAANGLAQTGMIVPFVGTFLTFSDYMRNAIRLAALSRTKVIYQFTHDSIFLGEDGPTHQPVEHYSALRAMPSLQVIRPGDSREVKMAWLAALKYEGPTAIILSRQDLPLCKGTEISYAEGLGRGGYIIKKEENRADYTLLATGSELCLALKVAEALEEKGKQVRVVSLPCWELFLLQEKSYQCSILGDGKKISIEAGVSHGWHRFIGIDGIAIAIDRYGESAPPAELAKEFGFTVEAIVSKILGE